MVKYVSWVYFGFIWKLFECSLNLKSIQIQTLNLFLILKLNSRLNYRAGPFSFPVRPRRPNPLHIAAQQIYPYPFLSFLSPTAGTHVSDDLSSLSSSFLSPASDAAARGDPRRSRVRAGWDARLVRLARTPRGRCAHARESNLPRGGTSPFAPALRAPASWLARREQAPPRPPGRSKPGQIGAFAPTFAAPGFKGKRGQRPGRPSPQPPLGFSLSSVVSMP
jgi:hypothetical protein